MRVRFEYLFKLGVAADLAGALYNKKLAPFAWIELEYSIRCDGEARLDMRASVVPSVQWYVEDMYSYGPAGAWTRRAGTEMERIGLKEFGEFVDTDKRCKGPAGRSFSLCVRCSEYRARG